MKATKKMNVNFMVVADVKDILLVGTKIVNCMIILLDKKASKKEAAKAEEIRQLS